MWEVIYVKADPQDMELLRQMGVKMFGVPTSDLADRRQRLVFAEFYRLKTS
jgi:hypothetical protein